MPYQIYETETFSKLYGAMEKVEQDWVNKIKLQLIENPNTGKPLKFEWFREKKFGKKAVLLNLQRRFKDFVGIFWLKKRTAENNQPYH